MAKTITSVVSKPNGLSSKTKSSLGLHLKKTPLRTLKSPSEELTEKIDSSAPPPFNLEDIRAVIPKHCWVKNPWMSMSYLSRDVAIVFGLAAVATYFNNWLLWPLYWFAQGTMFWALFNLGHDCGHGSFSDNPKLNNVVGHFLHSSLLVPYHGWRIKHRNHHQDSSDGDFFLPNEKKDVLISRVCWAAMAALLLSLNFALGPIQMIKLYVIPYTIMLTWLDLVTNLHHHSHEEKLPWDSEKEWSSLKDGLTTSDGDYGFINKINHNIGAHVMHHLFPEIPHYHLAEATEAAKPVLGKYYTEPKSSGPIPYHLLESLIKMYFKRNEMAQDSGGKKCKGLGFCKSFTHGIT